MHPARKVNQWRHRVPNSPYDTTEADGMNGAFIIPLDERTVAECIVSDGSCPDAQALAVEWEHVSVKIREKSGLTRIPTWKEMCRIKELFFTDDEAVIQIHPRKSEYVNVHPHVLHLWRPKDGELRLPPRICV